MPSPFPGMNPYLEQDRVWHDFHQHFSSVAVGLLMDQVGERYIAQIDTEVYVHELSGDERRLLGRPDVQVDDARTAGPRPRAADAGAGATTVAAPMYASLPPAVDVVSIPYIKILDAAGRTVVTVIELLGPTNKRRPEERAAYVARRRRILRSDSHLVEIDLLCDGERMPAEGLPRCDYCVLVSRREERPRVGVWPLRLRDPLPVVPVPLLAPDPDARLDLKAVLDRIYDMARYERYIYAGTPNPPLHPDDDRWAQQFLPKRP